MLNINLSAGKQANPVKIEMLFVYAVLQQADEPDIVGFFIFCNRQTSNNVLELSK